MILPIILAAWSALHTVPALAIASASAAAVGVSQGGDSESADE